MNEVSRRVLEIELVHMNDRLRQLDESINLDQAAVTALKSQRKTLREARQRLLEDLDHPTI